MTIREFIELHQQIFGLNEDTFNKIKTKISRELEKIPEWQNLENKISAGKTKSFVLDDITKEKLEKVMKPYFLKLSKMSQDEIEKQKRLHEIMIYNNHNIFQKSTKDNAEAYIYEVPKNDKLNVMIEALFYSQFELDEKRWSKDFSDYQLFLNDNNAKATDELAIIKLRLDNPLKHYVNKK